MGVWSSKAPEHYKQMKIMNWINNRWLVGIATSIIGGVSVTVFFWLSDPLTFISSDSTSLPPESVQTAAQQSTLLVTEERCDTVIKSIDATTHPREADENIQDIVLELMQESRRTNHSQRDIMLDCAERIAQRTEHVVSHDVNLLSVIDENIRVGRCQSAKQLVDDLLGIEIRKNEKLKVEQECLGKN